MKSGGVGGVVGLIELHKREQINTHKHLYVALRDEHLGVEVLVFRL